MAGSIALADYLGRIGFTGEPRRDDATLAELHRRHPTAIAFENLSTLTGRPVSLELADVEDKLVRARRGGYCFEHNLLFAAALEACGFDVQRLAARVVYNRDPDDGPLPRTHMLLRVGTGAGERLCDVGFGGLTMTAPLELEIGEQRAADTSFRLVESGGLYELAARIGGRWKPLYRFDLQPQLPADLEMMNHFVCTHPSSHFRTTLMAARAVESGRCALADNRFTLYRSDGSIEQRFAASVAELHGLITDELGIEIELDAALEAALARCVAA